jgi:hypothetical protein
MKPGSQPHAWSPVALAFSGHAVQVAALRTLLTARLPQDMHVRCTEVAEAVAAAYVPGRHSHAVCAALGSASEGAHVSHTAFSPPRDASLLPQALHVGACSATLRPNSAPIRLATSAFATP